MITVDLIDEKLNLSFKYYPDYISRVKRIGAIFDKETKSWFLDKSRLNSLCETFRGELFFIYPEWKLKGEKVPDFSYLYKINNPINIESLGFKLKPFKYQEFGIKFLIDRLKTHNMAFICDSMGLGKTAQAIGVIKHFSDNNEIKNTIIVCKKSIKGQWKEEFEKFINFEGNIYISDDLKKKRDKIYSDISDDKGRTILIINYHLLLNDAEIINELIKPDFVAYDECHVVKTYNGKLNTACRKISEKAKYTLFMTGTPIMSKPDDIFGIVSIKDKKYFGSKTDFFNHHVVEYYNGSFTNTVGYKNLDELRDKIQALILRRTSEEVTIDLPKIVKKNIYCSKDIAQKKANEIADLLEEEIKEEVDNTKTCLGKETDQEKIKSLKEKINSLEMSSKGLIAARQMIANQVSLLKTTNSYWIKKSFSELKVPANYTSSKLLTLIDLVDDIKSANQKVIIFTKYATMANFLVKLLNSKKYNSVAYTGNLSNDSREEVIKSFKYNNDITAIVGTDALAEGVSLQIANNVIHFDLAFNDAIVAQREGRVRRAGSKYSTAFVYYLLTDETIDINIYNKVIETKKTFNSFIELNKEQSKIIKELSN